MSNFKRSEQTQILKGVELQWAFLNKVNDMSQKYQVDLTNLTDEQIAQIESLKIDGIKPKIRTSEKAPQKGKFITVKSSNEIFPLDTNGDRITALVGNGSKANMRLGSFKWKKPVGKEEGVSLSLEKLVITDLVVYNGGGSSSKDDSELFSTDTI